MKPAPGWRMWAASSAMMLCTMLSYVDRQTLAVLSPTILHDTGLSAAAYADALSAFSIAYMLTNPLWGSMLDYIGLRAGLLAAVALWSAASAAHAWVTGFIGFAVARTLLGIGEGAVFPGALKAAFDSLPANRQSRGMAIGYSGAAIGAILTPLIVTPVALAFGWRSAFLLTGAMGGAWLLLWTGLARPPFLDSRPARTAAIAWPNFFERRAWLIVATFGLGGVALGVIGYLSPLYLNRVMGLSQGALGEILWIPMLGWGVGYYFWGWIADRYPAVDQHPSRLFLLMAVLALPSALTTRIHSWPLVVALFCWAMFIADGFIVLSLRWGARLYTGGQTAMVAGIGSGSWSAVLAVLLPLYGRWFDQRQYGAIFISMSLLPACGTLLWICLRPVRKLRWAAART